MTSQDGARRALTAAQDAAAGRAWLVGGAVRDALLRDAPTARVGGRPAEPVDLDLVVSGDPRRVAAAVGDALDAPRFQLSDRFGGHRVVAGALQVDVMPLHAGGLRADLEARDLTVNALAVDVETAAAQWPRLAVDEVHDPLGGLLDLRLGVLRSCGPAAMADDPLRVVRIARMVATGTWSLDGDLAPEARAAAPGLTETAGERIGAELRLLVGGGRPLEGLRVLHEIGATAVVLPELDELAGVRQSAYHHRDVLGHTLEVLAHALDLEQHAGTYVDDESAAAWRRVLGEPLGGGWTRRDAVRWAALVHDIAKPQTRIEHPTEGWIGFPGHDRVGAGVAERILGRLRAPRAVARLVATMTREHLRLGFMIHDAPIDDGGWFDYLRSTAPAEVEVTMLSLADRLATRGRRLERAGDRHGQLAREALPRALAWRAGGGAPAPLLDGGELMRRLGRPPGPWLQGALERQQRARYADPGLGDDQALRAALDDAAGG